MLAVFPQSVNPGLHVLKEVVTLTEKAFILLPDDHWHYNQLTTTNSGRCPTSNVIKTYKCVSEPNLRNRISNLRKLAASCNYNMVAKLEKKSEKENRTDSNG